MNKSDSINELAAALAKVKFGKIERDKSVKVALKTGGSYSFQYAPMETIMSAIRGPLAEQNLSLTQSVLCSPDNSPAGVETALLHSSGQWLTSYVPIQYRSGMTAQEMGSAITYARRYGVTLVGCLVADEDDDGNVADGNHVETVERPLTSPHKPTDGALARLAVDEQTWIRDVEAAVRKLANSGDIKGACDHVDEQGFGADQKAALWETLADDSKLRSAMKKEWNSRKEAA